jgi:hypothetical protein
MPFGSGILAWRLLGFPAPGCAPVLVIAWYKEIDTIGTLSEKPDQAASQRIVWSLYLAKAGPLTSADGQQA